MINLIPEVRRDEVSGVRDNFVVKSAFFFHRRHRLPVPYRLMAHGRQVGMVPQKGGKRNGKRKRNFHESKRNPSKSNLLRSAGTKDLGQRRARAKNWRLSVMDNEDVNHMLSLVREGRRLCHREKGREKKETRIYTCVSDTP